MFSIRALRRAFRLHRDAMHTARVPRGAFPPVTPEASPEARALLEYLHDIGGSSVLLGQHNFPANGGRNLDFAATYLGKVPVIFSTDWGFAGAGSHDAMTVRQSIVEEAIRRHQNGAIITICWHAVPPTADEPVTFQPLPGASPGALRSVRGRLLDTQFKELLTPGTPLHQRWCAQVDVIASSLARLRDARVPVLWRPYHEMNGDWFWWGGRPGKHGSTALYRQLFDRLARHHGLNNLLWVWSVDRPVRKGMGFKKFYPGDDSLDILALDAYDRDFAQEYYEGLLRLSGGKPLLLAEVGNPPPPDVLQRQPQWVGFTVWAGMVRDTSPRQWKQITDEPRILGLEDPAFRHGIASYRAACGLAPLSDPASPSPSYHPDFSGTWLFNADFSTLDTDGMTFVASRMVIVQHEAELLVHRTFIQEYEDPSETSDTVFLDGRESRSMAEGFQQVTRACWSARGKSLELQFMLARGQGGQSLSFPVEEEWSLSGEGTVLWIRRDSHSPHGERTSTLIFTRK